MNEMKQSSLAVTFETEAVKEALNADPEFLLSARYWNVWLRLLVGDTPYFLHIADDRVVRFDDQPSGFDP